MTNSYLSKNGCLQQQQDASTTAATPRPLTQDQQQQKKYPSETSLPASAVGPTPIVSTHTLVISDGDGSSISIPLVRADELPAYIHVATPTTSQSKLVGQDCRFNKIMAYADVSHMSNDGHISFNSSFHTIWSDMADRRPNAPPPLPLLNTSQYGSFVPFSPLLQSNGTRGGGGGALESTFLGGNYGQHNLGLQGIAPNGPLDINDLNSINQALAELSLASHGGTRSHPDTQDFEARQQYLLEQGLFRKEPCNAWRQKGHCKWGDRCTYSHDHQPASAFSAYPLLQGVKVLQAPVGGAPGLSPVQQQCQQQQLTILQLQQALLHQQQQNQQALLETQTQQQSSSLIQPPQSPSARLHPTAPAYTPKRLHNLPTTPAPYRPPPTRTPGPAPKPKGQKTHCAYFFRTGQCDFMQQGCKYSHERPEDPITRTVGNSTIVVVPGKNSPPVSSPSTSSVSSVEEAPRESVAIKPRPMPIDFANLNRTATSPHPQTTETSPISVPVNPPGSLPGSTITTQTAIYSPLGGLQSMHGSSSHILRSPTSKMRKGTVSSRSFLDALGKGKAENGGGMMPIGSGRFEGVRAIWGDGGYKRMERVEKVEKDEGGLKAQENPLAGGFGLSGMLREVMGEVERARGRMKEEVGGELITFE